MKKKKYKQIDWIKQMHIKPKNVVIESECNSLTKNLAKITRYMANFSNCTIENFCHCLLAWYQWIFNDKFDSKNGKGYD